jgi:GntR family transcriptional regulator, arabinose operon transcriptional repressor
MEKQLLSLDLRHDSSGLSKHERLREHLVNEMISGRLKPGQSLPSERQFAEKLGVAYMTVRQTMASLENEGLIRRVPGKGTFVEDDARRKLRRGQDIFALVVPMTRAGFYPSLLHGFETAAGDINHQTLICSTNDDVARQADIILQLMDKNVGGVAINPTAPRPTPAYQIRQLQEHNIPTVFCHRRVEGVSAPLLALPYRSVGRTAGRALQERGHRRVVFFTWERSLGTTEYEEGFREAMQAGESDASVQSVFLEDLGIADVEEAGRVALKRLFSQPEPPTAIFCTFDSLGEMIIAVLPSLGLRTPEDVSLLGFGGTWREGVLTKQLTSVVVDEIDTGRRAVSLLHEMRCGKRPIDDNIEIVMELALSAGRTLGPVARDQSKAS